MSSSELYIPGETIVPYQCTPGPEEEVVATVIRKIFAALSVFGSAFIISTIYQKWRRNWKSIDPYCRIMLGLSVYDIIWSFFPWFMGSWLMPAETGHWGASGNTQTCTLQGFFFWLGVPGAQYYQILLSLHTLLLVTFRWTPIDFHKRIERWSHPVTFVVALVLATVPLFFEGYNPECSTCLPAPLPIWCGDWIFWGDGETECLRGSPKLSQTYYIIYLTNLSIMGVFCTGSMIQVYWTVRRQEDRNSRYASFRSGAHREKSRRIRRTMILYTFGFYLCWIVPSFIIHFAKQGTPMMVMSYILLPFQGFFNMLIFLAPKCAKYQREHPGTWLAMAYVRIVFGSCSVPLRWFCGSERMEAIRRRTSRRIQNPFRLSSSFSNLASNVSNISWRGTQPTEIMNEAPWDEDDGIGFNDFNEPPTTSADSRANQRLSTGRTIGTGQEEGDLNGDGHHGEQKIMDMSDSSLEKSIAFYEDKREMDFNEDPRTSSADSANQEPSTGHPTGTAQNEGRLDGADDPCEQVIEDDTEPND